MGLSGEIKPGKDKNPDTIALTGHKAQELQTTVKKLTKNKKSKGKKKHESSSSKKKRKTKELVTPISQKVHLDKSSTSDKDIAGAESSALNQGELSPFSLWLGTLSKSTVSEIQPSKTEKPSEAKAKEEISLQTGPQTIVVQSLKSKKALSKETTIDQPIKTESAQPQEKIAQPQSKTLKDLEADQAVERPKSKKKKKKKKKRPYDSGVVLSDDIFSETLADLLASQGHFRQAIQMYEKMRLIYPEKSRFFAAKIEELNKKE